MPAHVPREVEQKPIFPVVEESFIPEVCIGILLIEYIKIEVIGVVKQEYLGCIEAPSS